MTKPEIQRSTKNILPETVFGNLLDFDRIRRQSIIVYGRPHSGKTLLCSYEAARLAKIHGGGILIYSSEANYASTAVVNTIKSIFDGFGVRYEIREVESVDSMTYELTKMRKEAVEEKASAEGNWTPEWRIIIVDSLNSMRILIENTMTYFQRKSLGGMRSVISQLERVTWTVSRYAEAVDGWGILINSGTATIGKLYRGIAPYKPSYGEKAVHHTVGEVWLANPEDFPENVKNKVLKSGKDLMNVRMAVVVSSREGGVGKGIVFEFEKTKSDSGVEYVKPTPLFAVEYKPEEEMI